MSKIHTSQPTNYKVIGLTPTTSTPNLVDT